MAEKEEKKALSATEAESPASFLVTLSNALRENENVDVGLVDILANHILLATPAADAVARARIAILKLADERANPRKPQAGNG